MASGQQDEKGPQCAVTASGRRPILLWVHCCNRAANRALLGLPTSIFLQPAPPSRCKAPEPRVSCRLAQQWRKSKSDTTLRGDEQAGKQRAVSVEHMPCGGDGRAALVSPILVSNRPAFCWCHLYMALTGNSHCMIAFSGIQKG